MFVISGLAPLALLAGCNTSGPAAAPGVGSPRLERALGDVLTHHQIVTAGMGILRDGKLVWEGYFGEQSPGVPASAATRFNVASITKTITTETILRLAGQGRLSLDERMAPHWVDPDVAGDPRHLLLTPRLALDHQTGFPNWRFFLPGGKLAFQSSPGERYGYSGEGLEYLARFAERKLGRPFPELVAETVLAPLGMTSTSIVVRRSEAADLARPVDLEGRFPGYWCRPEGKGWCRPEGNWSAADDMVTTVRDYAVFLLSVAKGEGYLPAIAAARDRVQTDKGDQAIVDCAATPSVPVSRCPRLRPRLERAPLRRHDGARAWRVGLGGAGRRLRGDAVAGRPDRFSERAEPPGAGRHARAARPAGSRLAFPARISPLAGGSRGARSGGALAPPPRLKD